MTIYSVQDKVTGIERYKYTADAPIEWTGFEFSNYNHIPLVDAPVEETPIDPTKWRIWVGPFFDRFGASKLAILSSTDPVVQAVITDASVRRYIDLYNRRAELMQIIQLLQSKGFALDPSLILDVQPTSEEVWNG